MIIVIFASDELKFANNKKQLMALGYLEGQILFANSNKETRLDVIKKYSQKWLFFIDHDCMLTRSQADSLNSIIKAMDKSTNNRVVAGVYTDSEQSTSIQKSHNWIANTWLSSSYQPSSNNSLLLGGVFLVYSNASHFENDLGVGVWGAEDKHLAWVLKKADFEFSYKAELQVEHTTTKSFAHFVKRAYLHGINDVKFFTQDSQGSSFLYWLRKIDYLNVRLVALVALHFSVQKVAKIFQTIRQLNK